MKVSNIKPNSEFYAMAFVNLMFVVGVWKGMIPAEGADAAIYVLGANNVGYMLSRGWAKRGTP